MVILPFGIFKMLISISKLLEDLQGRRVTFSKSSISNKQINK